MRRLANQIIKPPSGVDCGFVVDDLYCLVGSLCVQYSVFSSFAIISLRVGRS